MMGQQVGLSSCNFWKTLLKLCGDLSMYVLTPTLEQGAVCGLLDEGMFERVLGVGGYTSPEYQLGGNELVQGVIELL
jgi:hypothetical protein